MRALVTGANGFIGSHLCEHLVKTGGTVRAMVRKSSNLQWIESLNLELVYADLRDEESVREAVKGCDRVFHLGATVRAKDPAEFERVNAQGTRTLAEACVDAGVARFVLFSSLSAAGPAEGAARPLTEKQECRPVSDYGRAKLAAEQVVQGLSGRLHSVILRFPAVYGPRDRDGLVLWRCLSTGVMPLFGGSFSLIYVADAVRAALLAAERTVESGSVYFVSDGNCYTVSDVAAVAEQLLGKRAWKVRLPSWLLCGAAAVSEWLNREGTIFNRDKARELVQSCWVCSLERARAELGFEPEYDLERGLAMTLDWYRESGWL
jgi:nucleoside-diphosphate-sugar epimerase